jgi:hypothetical protein
MNTKFWLESLKGRPEHMRIILKLVLTFIDCASQLMCSLAGYASC